MTSCDQATMLNQLITFQLADESSVHERLPFVMDCIVTRLLLKDQEDQESVAVVRRKWTIRLNALLQSKQSSARWAALVLIKLTCEQSMSLLYGHIKSWTGQLLGVVAKPEATMVRQVAIETLMYLFSFTANKPELLREVALPNLQRFNQTLLTLTKTKPLCATALGALKSNVVHFPSQSRHIMDQCLRVCIGCLNGEHDKETVAAACECLASLHQVSGKTSHSEQWKEIMMHLIGSVHVCLHQLFDTIDEELALPGLPPSYELDEVSADPMEAFPVLLCRIQALHEAIVTCLGSASVTVVSVPVVSLVDLICRVYNVFEGSLMREFKDKNEYICLMNCLPLLHLTTNKVTMALLLSSGSHLSKYVKLFSRVLVRLLNEYKSQRSIKVSVYGMITLCLQSFGFGFGESVGKPLVESVLEDIKVCEQKLTDAAPTEIKSKSTKRKRDGLTNSDVLATVGASTQAPFDIQVAALEALQSFLNCYGSSMDLQSRNAVDASILSRLLQTGLKPFGSTSERDSVVKEKLYHCLLASVMNPIEVQASILPHALRIFSAGLNEQNYQLQSVCKQGLAICDLIIHPRMPPIQSTTSTITAKIQQAEQDNEKPVNATASYPEIKNTITSQHTVEETDTLVEQHTVVTIKEPIVITDTIETRGVQQAETRDVQQAEIRGVQQAEIRVEQDTKADVASSGEQVAESRGEQDTKTSNQQDIKTNSDVTVATNKITFDDDETEDFAIHDDNDDKKDEDGDDASEEPSGSNTIALLDSDDDLELPDIDMAGPDSDMEEDE